MPKMHALEFPDEPDPDELHPVYALVGEEDYLRSRCLARLRDAVETEEQPGSMVTEFEGAVEPSDIFDELRTIPFMGMEGRRMVILRDAGEFISSHEDSLKNYLASPSSHGILVLVCDDLSGNSAVSKAVVETGVRVDCSELRWKRARQWVKEEARRMGKKMGGRAANMLVEAIGPNLFGLRSELAKLRDYVGEGEEITAEDIDAMVPHSRSRSIFEIGDAVVGGDTAKAIDLAEELLLRGESLSFMVSIMANRVRQLWRIKRLSRRGMGQKKIAGKVGVPPFVVRKSLKLADRTKPRRLARQLKVLADSDYELKTRSVGAAEERAWLTRLVTRLGNC